MFVTPSTQQPEEAALRIQAVVRGRSGRTYYELLRDEEACRQWVAYYVAVGEYENAKELGWDGENLSLPTKGSRANIAAVCAARNTAKGAAAFSLRWFHELGQTVTQGVQDVLTPLNSGRSEPAAPPGVDATARQIVSAVVIQSWARMMLARSALQAQQHDARAAALQARLEDTSARRIQKVCFAKKLDAAHSPRGRSISTLFQEEQSIAAIIVCRRVLTESQSLIACFLFLCLVRSAVAC